MTYAIFLVTYVSYMKARTTRQRYGLIVGMYVLGVASFPINTGASGFFIYSAAFLPFVVASVPILVTILIAQALGLLVEGLLLHINPIALTLTTFILCIVGQATPSSPGKSARTSNSAWRTKRSSSSPH